MELQLEAIVTIARKNKKKEPVKSVGSADKSSACINMDTNANESMLGHIQSSFLMFPCSSPL